MLVDRSQVHAFCLKCAFAFFNKIYAKKLCKPYAKNAIELAVALDKNHNKKPFAPNRDLVCRNFERDRQT